MLKEFSLSNLKDLDSGKIDAVFRAARQAVVADIMARPNEKAKRTVTLVFGYTPIVVDDVCDEMKVTVDVKTTVPPRKSREYHMAIKENGDAFFNAGSPQDVRQHTIGELIDDADAA